MEEFSYRISLHSSLGKRPGALTLWIQDGIVNGELELLRQRTEVTGTLDADGHLKVTGTLITFRQTIPYVAEGTMDSGGIKMQLHAGDSVYELTGTKNETKERVRL